MTHENECKTKWTMVGEQEANTSVEGRLAESGKIKRYLTYLVSFVHE